MYNFLLRASHWLSTYTSWFIIAVALLTYFVPGLFSWVHGTTQSCILGFIMLTMGLTLTMQDSPGFDINKFDYFISSKWPKNIIRAKGLVYFAHNTDMSYIFEQAGVQKKLTEAGYWYATAPEEELRQLKEMDPNIEKDWDPVYGDRMIKLVFIGQNLDRKALTEALDACLADKK